MEHPSFYTLFR